MLTEEPVGALILLYYFARGLHTGNVPAKIAHCSKGYRNLGILSSNHLHLYVRLKLTNTSSHVACCDHFHKILEFGFLAEGDW